MEHGQHGQRVNLSSMIMVSKLFKISKNNVPFIECVELKKWGFRITLKNRKEFRSQIIIWCGNCNWVDAIRLNFLITSWILVEVYKVSSPLSKSVMVSTIHSSTITIVHCLSLLQTSCRFHFKIFPLLSIFVVNIVGVSWIEQAKYTTSKNHYTRPEVL